MNRPLLTKILTCLMLLSLMVFQNFALAAWPIPRSAQEVSKQMTRLGAQFSISEITETKPAENEIKVRIYKGYYQRVPGSPAIYFEYRLPENYRGIDVVESAGFTKDSKYWEGPNQIAEFEKNGYGILTFDGLVRGNSLEAIPKNQSVPTVVTTMDEAKLVKTLIESLGLNKIVSVGHSRGAGIAARLSKFILNENGENSKKPIKLVAHYDINGLVSYSTAFFPMNTFVSMNDFNGGYVGKEIERLMPDGTTKRIKLRRAQEYFDELLSQWTQFENEFFEQSKKYQEIFIRKDSDGFDKWDPQAQEISAELFNELLAKFPLLIQNFDSMQSMAERAMVEMMTEQTGPKRDRDYKSLQAMMRGLRTAFTVKDGMFQRKFVIPHSVLPALVEIANAGVAVTVVYGTNDDIVRPHHAAVKVALLKKIKGVKIVEDTKPSEGPNKTHYGPNRSIWQNIISPLIRGHAQAVSCNRGQR